MFFFLFFIFVTPFCPGSFSGTAIGTSIVNRLLEPLWPIDSTVGRLVDIVCHLGSHIPQKLPKRGVNRHFQAKLANIKTGILSKLLHRFQPNFAQWQRPTNTLRGWSKYCYTRNSAKTNPRWRTAAIWKNRKSAIYLRKFSTDRHEIGHGYV